LRLLHVHSRSIFIANLLILLFGGMLFFGLFNYLIDRNIYQTLQDRKDFVRRQLATSDSLYVYQNFSAHVFSIKSLPRPFPVAEQITDTVIFDPVKKRSLLFRQLTFSDTFRNQAYLITIRRPYLGDIEVMRGILVSLAIMTVVLIAAFYFSGKIISKNLWQPFYTTLAQLKNYQLDERAKIHFPDTRVAEFKELNLALMHLIERIETHYQDLKEYTENTTHEIQTPLAIIQSKLELLQDSGLSHRQLLLLHTARQSVNRLAKLKEALLLLARIKNNQFSHTQTVCMASLLEARLAHVEELISLKQIQLHLQLEQRVSVTMNPVLAEVLLDNLLSNAIKYTQPGGILKIQLQDTDCMISNTGEPPGKPTSALFDRFTKADPQSRSLGLGLAIVKAICEKFHLWVAYEYENGFHRVHITFPPAEQVKQ
jgi:signal transduction histidine kinase